MYIGSMKNGHKHMRHRHSGHRHRDAAEHRFDDAEGMEERRSGRHRHHRFGRFGDRRGSRPFDYGELRLLTLAMIAEQPRHGYELMKAIEERMGGTYSPSPGVIYPTLAWLEDMHYAAVETQDAGRKRYRITTEGEAFLTANRAAVDALLSRVGQTGDGRYEGVPAPVLRAMQNLKLALRLRLRRGALDQATAEAIAAALDAAAQAVERSGTTETRSRDDRAFI
jgi:DNA-binding PadR family transcriptional regulator